MASIIAIETATSSCSAALRIDGELVERSLVGSNVHSQVLLTMVDELLCEAGLSPQQLDAVAVGQGPGSFTGLRIGVGVGQGVAYGGECPMVGVSSLAALALAAPADGTVVAGIDARMGEIYWGEFQKSGDHIGQVGSLSVSNPAVLSERFTHSNADKLQLVGNAWAEYWDQLDHQPGNLISEIIFPSAAMLLRLAEQKFENGDVVSAVEFQPIYVRNDVAKKSSKLGFKR